MTIAIPIKIRVGKSKRPLRRPHMLRNCSRLWLRIGQWTGMTALQIPELRVSPCLRGCWLLGKHVVLWAGHAGSLV